MKIDINGTWCLSRGYGTGLEDPDRDLAAIDRALLLRDDEITAVHDLPSISDGVSLRVAPIVLYGYLVSGEPTGTVLVPVLQEDRVEP